MVVDDLMSWGVRLFRGGDPLRNCHRQTVRQRANSVVLRPVGSPEEIQIDRFPGLAKAFQSVNAP